jgi:hypothetical protein
MDSVLEVDLPGVDLEAEEEDGIARGGSGWFGNEGNDAGEVGESTEK